MEKMTGLDRSLANLQLLEHQLSGLRVKLSLESAVTLWEEALPLLAMV